MAEIPAAIPLPPDLLERLRHELKSPDLKRRLLAFARKRAGVLRLAGIPTTDNAAHEAEILAQDAITSTILGQRTWDPTIPLYAHLCGVIRSETNNRAVRAQRHAHFSVEACNLENSDDDLDGVDASIARQARDDIAVPRHVASASDAALKLMRQLRELAKTKPARVQDLINAYAAGCETRREVIEMTGMTSVEFRNARRILDRMLTALPDELHDGARSALEVTRDY